MYDSRRRQFGRIGCCVGRPIQDRHRFAPKKFALLAGLAYALGGVIGFFFTGFSNFTEGTGVPLFGLFHITPFHNVVHIGVGGLWLLAAFTLTRPATEGVNLAIGGVYALAAVLGYLGKLEFLGLRPDRTPITSCI